MLVLAQNALSSLPEEVASLSALVHLDLSHNSIKTLPSLAALTNLRVCALHHNALTVLPPLPSALSDLDASFNRLSAPYIGEHLPTLATLTALRTLNLSHNSLRTLPPALAQCVALEELTLDGCALSAPALPELPALRRLSITNAHLRTLALPSLPNLAELFLSHNALEALPSLDAAPGLRLLDVAHNALTALPPLTLASLRLLLVSHNKVTHLLPLALPALEVLDVSHNAIAELNALDLPSLTALDLSSNSLTGLPPLACRELHYLRLHLNPIASLPPLPSLSLISLAHVQADPTRISVLAALRAEHVDILCACLSASLALLGPALIHALTHSGASLGMWAQPAVVDALLAIARANALEMRLRKRAISALYRLAVDRFHRSALVGESCEGLVDALLALLRGVPPLTAPLLRALSILSLHGAAPRFLHVFSSHRQPRSVSFCVSASRWLSSWHSRTPARSECAHRPYRLSVHLGM